ncbi:MAG: hypothetical protein JSR46_09190, partial [Verrucomicrobia bacterium]|nr:hypothetical protein [Verrucomicrobiota bacterium]
AISSSSYKQLRGSDHPDILFLEDLCYHMYLQEAGNPDRAGREVKAAKGMGDFCSYVYEQAKKSEEHKPTLDRIENKIATRKVDSNDIGDLVNQMVLFSRTNSYERDSHLGVFVHTLAHPSRILNSIRSNIDTEWMPYSAHESGNPIQPLMVLNVTTAEGKTISALHVEAGSPTKGGVIGPIAHGLIDAFKRRGMHWMDVNLQDSKGAEGKRSKAIVDENQNHENITFSSDTVDGHVFEKGTGLVESNGSYSPEQFHEKFSTYVLTGIHEYEIGGNGYYIPERTTGKTVQDSVTSALEQTKALFTSLSSGGVVMKDEETLSQFNNLKPEQKARLHQYTFQVIKNIGELALKMDALSKQGATAEQISLMFIEHCKEDIDRGAIKNIISTLLFLQLSGVELDRDTLLGLIAPLLGRAQNTNDRTILIHRLQPFLDLMKS